ncbi:MAG: DUF4058 family protein [Chloroflexaceae bacterium]|nr:DUF4058 family protein [Chloroflexaceae bacterium]
MPTPFPGMDPYLEAAGLWTNVHSSVIIALRDELAPRLRPRYYVAVEERTLHLSSDDMPIAARPDLAIIERSSPVPAAVAGGVVQGATAEQVVTVEVPLSDEVRELFLEIRTAASEQVITVIELLSPTNKTNPTGRAQYERKRLALLGSQTHLVELDLLRAGPPMQVRGYDQPNAYRILVSRATHRPKADLLPFDVRQPIPPFQLPLEAGDPEPVIALTPLMHALYDRAGYDLRIDYRTNPPPPTLTPDDAAWLDALLRAAGLR